MGSNMISKRDGLTGCAEENNLINKIIKIIIKMPKSFNNLYPNVVMNTT